MYSGYLTNAGASLLNWPGRRYRFSPRRQEQHTTRFPSAWHGAWHKAGNISNDGKGPDSFLLVLRTKPRTLPMLSTHAAPEHTQSTAPASNCQHSEDRCARHFSRMPTEPPRAVLRDFHERFHGLVLVSTLNSEDPERLR